MRLCDKGWPLASARSTAYPWSHPLTGSATALAGVSIIWPCAIVTGATSSTSSRFTLSMDKCSVASCAEAVAAKRPKRPIPTMRIDTSPALGNQYTDDPALRDYLAWKLPAAMLASIEPALTRLGQRAVLDIRAAG